MGDLQLRQGGDVLGAFISVQLSYWDCFLIHAFELGFRRSEHFTVGPHQVTDSFHQCEAQGSDKAVPKAWRWHRKATKVPDTALELDRQV